jgi:hypothetical protein
MAILRTPLLEFSIIPRSSSNSGYERIDSAQYSKAELPASKGVTLTAPPHGLNSVWLFAIPELNGTEMGVLLLGNVTVSPVALGHTPPVLSRTEYWSRNEATEVVLMVTAWGPGTLLIVPPSLTDNLRGVPELLVICRDG